MFKLIAGIASILTLSDGQSSLVTHAYKHHKTLKKMSIRDRYDYYLKEYEFIEDSYDDMVENAVYSPDEEEFENLVRFGMEKPFK